MSLLTNYDPSMKPLISLPAETVQSATLYSYKANRTKQAKPYNIPTNYLMRVHAVLKAKGSYTGRKAGYSMYPVASMKERSYAYNKAYERFVSKLGDTSQFGATATAEGRKTLDMFTNLALTMYRAAKSAKRGDFLGVLNELGFDPPVVRVTRTIRRKRRRPVRVSHEYYRMPNGRSVVKKAGSSWLLWSYGVQPLMSDVHNAAEVFKREFPATKIQGRATEPVKRQTVASTTVWMQRHTLKGSIRVLITADVVVNNHKLWLKNQLGLINPAQWLNEAVPFSFVIDWFSNWSSVIMSLTDFAGLTLTNQCVSTTYKVNEDYNLWYKPGFDENREFGPHDHLITELTEFVRTVGNIPGPSLEFRYERFEWQRGLNAISLLVGFLKDPSLTKNKR